MKNTYIIAIDSKGMPTFIKQANMTCICYIGRNYKNAYICDNKKEAEKIWKDWFNAYIDKQFLSNNQ